MELHIKSEFDCIYFINGVMYERVDSLTMSEYDVVYITVLPLKHTLLPYTVKLNGADNVSDELCSGLRLGDDHYLLTLAPRYMIVYGSADKQSTATSGRITRLFNLVKNGDVNAAYAMLSESLRATIGKSDLAAFFDDYDRIAECYWDDSAKFYLIDKNGKTQLHSYTLKDEFIDNIVECEE